MSIEAQIETRENLNFNNITRIEADVRRARQRTDEEVAVLVLDPRDEHGRAIVALAGRLADAEAHIAEAERRGLEPLVISADPRRLVIAVVRNHFPELADTSAQFDARAGYLVIAVACGGAAATVVQPGDFPGERPVVRLIMP